MELIDTLSPFVKKICTRIERLHDDLSDIKPDVNYSLGSDGSIKPCNKSSEIYKKQYEAWAYSHSNCTDEVVYTHFNMIHLLKSHETQVIRLTDEVADYVNSLGSGEFSTDKYLPIGKYIINCRINGADIVIFYQCIDRNVITLSWYSTNELYNGLCLQNIKDTFKTVNSGNEITHNDGKAMFDAVSFVVKLHQTIYEKIPVDINVQKEVYKINTPSGKKQLVKEIRYISLSDTGKDRLNTIHTNKEKFADSNFTALNWYCRSHYRTVNDKEVYVKDHWKQRDPNLLSKNPIPIVYTK